MMAGRDTSCDDALRQLILPETKGEKIIYFLWLDDQIMQLWSEYLILKAQYEASTTPNQQIEKKINSRLELVDYFEMYLQAIRLYVTLNEIDEWIMKNDYWKKVVYNRI